MRKWLANRQTSARLEARFVPCHAHALGARIITSLVLSENPHRPRAPSTRSCFHNTTTSHSVWRVHAVENVFLVLFLETQWPLGSTLSFPLPQGRDYFSTIMVNIVCVWLGGFRLDGKSLYNNLDSETLQFKVVQWNDGFSGSQFFVWMTLSVSSLRLQNKV